MFTFDAADSGTTAGDLDQILDWEATDALNYATAGSAGNYVEAGTAADYATALTNATTFFTGSAGTEYYVVQVGTDVVVFSDNGTNAPVDAVVLVGRTLDDIAFANIV